MQAMSDLVDFLFPFGQQIQTEDVHFSAFRHRTRTSTLRKGLQVQEMGWSGRDYSLCYNLKSIESRPTEVGHRWSIRHCAISHTFDIECLRQNWIIIKAGPEIQDRVASAAGDYGLPDLRNYQSIDRAFAASLMIHLIICDWSLENWRWYVNRLEHDFRDLSDRTVVDDVEFFPVSRKQMPIDVDKPARSKTGFSLKSIRSKMSKSEPIRPISRTESSMDARLKSPIPQFHKDPVTGDPLPPGMTLEDIEMSSSLRHHSEGDPGQTDFTFRDLQTIHDMDSKAKDAALVIEHNLIVLGQLQEYYLFLFESKSLPKEIKDCCEEEVNHFELRVKGVANEFRAHKARLDALLSLIDDRRTLVRRISGSRLVRI